MYENIDKVIALYFITAKIIIQRKGEITDRSAFKSTACQSILKLPIVKLFNPEIGVFDIVGIIKMKGNIETVRINDTADYNDEACHQPCFLFFSYHFKIFADFFGSSKYLDRLLK